VRFCRDARDVIAYLREAGDAVLKATGERWFGGHTVGRFQAKGFRANE